MPPETGIVGVGTAATPQTHEEESTHDGLRHAPSRHTRPDSQSAFTSQAPLQVTAVTCVGAGVGVGVLDMTVVGVGVEVLTGGTVGVGVGVGVLVGESTGINVGVGVLVGVLVGDTSSGRDGVGVPVGDSVGVGVKTRGNDRVHAGTTAWEGPSVTGWRLDSS